MHDNFITGRGDCFGRSYNGKHTNRLIYILWNQGPKPLQFVYTNQTADTSAQCETMKTK